MNRAPGLIDRGYCQRCQANACLPAWREVAAPRRRHNSGLPRCLRRPLCHCRRRSCFRRWPGARSRLQPKSRRQAIENISQGRRIGEHLGGGVGAGDVLVVIGAGVEVEHRLRTARGEAGELDECLVDDRRFAGGADAGRTVVRIAAEAAAGGQSAGIRRAASDIGVDADERAQDAPGRSRASVEFDAAERIPAIGVTRALVGVLTRCGDVPRRRRRRLSCGSSRWPDSRERSYSRRPRRTQ